MGAWVVYGLGTESRDLPGFVTIDPIADLGGAMNYGSAFLPATFQGTRLGGTQRGLPNLASAASDRLPTRSWWRPPPSVSRPTPATCGTPERLRRHERRR